MVRRPRFRNRGKLWSSRLSFSGRDAWELFVRDFAVQASICAIGQNVDALNVEIEYDLVTLHAYILEPDAETISDLEHIRGELQEALDLCVTPTPQVLIQTAVGIDGNGPEWDGFWHMSIYKRHSSLYIAGQPETSPDGPKSLDD